MSHVLARRTFLFLACPTKANFSRTWQTRMSARGVARLDTCVNTVSGVRETKASHSNIKRACSDQFQSENAQGSNGCGIKRLSLSLRPLPVSFQVFQEKSSHPNLLIAVSSLLASLPGEELASQSFNSSNTFTAHKRLLFLSTQTERA